MDLNLSAKERDWLAHILAEPSICIWNSKFNLHGQMYPRSVFGRDRKPSGASNFLLVFGKF